MSDRKNTLLAFIAGAAAGAALGVLFAPQSGKGTREQMGKKARDAKESLDDLLNEGRRKWSEAQGRAAHTATMTEEDVSDLVRFLVAEGQDLWERIKNASAEEEEERSREGQA